MERKPITIDEGACVLCGECVDVCLSGVLEKEEEIINIAHPDMCNICGHCVSVCPTDAVAVGKNEPIPLPAEKPVTPEQLMLLLRSRRSTRSYLKDPVPDEVIREVIESARFAPTGSNLQSIYFTVVKDPGVLEAVRQLVISNLDGRVRGWEELAEANQRDGTPIPIELETRVERRRFYRKMVETAQGDRDVVFHEAPVLILLHSDTTGATPKDDGDLMAMCMLLMAESLGLGTCLLGLLNAAVVAEKSLQDKIKLPENHQVVASFVMGYPDVKFRKAPGRNPTRVTWL